MSKIIDINDRVPARKRRRKLRTNIKFTVLLSIFLFAILSLLYFQSSYSKIQQINISGNVLLDKESYLNLTGININDSMWGFKTTEIVEEIKQNEWVQDVIVERKLLTTVNIKIKEWPKVAYIEQQQLLYPILENGYVFDKTQVIDPIDAPVFSNFSDEKIRKKIVKQLAKLKPEVLALISQVNSNATESDPTGIILYMNDGYEVRAEISSFASKLNYYPSIVALIEEEEVEKGIIDIEVGSYFRPFSGEYQSLSLNDGADLTNQEGSTLSEQSGSEDGDDGE
jgi:cell division protein FtsQ